MRKPGAIDSMTPLQIATESSATPKSVMNTTVGADPAAGADCPVGALVLTLHPNGTSSASSAEHNREIRYAEAMRMAELLSARKGLIIVRQRVGRTQSGVGEEFEPEVFLPEDRREGARLDTDLLMTS